jgi:hypothetical protein
MDKKDNDDKQRKQENKESALFLSGSIVLRSFKTFQYFTLL